MHNSLVDRSWDGQGFLLESNCQNSADSIVCEVVDYLKLFHKEQNLSEACLSARIADVKSQLQQTGTYWQSTDELSYGAKVAWRNNVRCIGRIYWNSLSVRDLRYLSTAEDIFAALVEHIRLATNGGSIRSIITIFAPNQGHTGIRIWNPLLIRYAGYQQSGSSILGDPAQAQLTEILQRMGWKGGAGTRFDILPLVIQMRMALS